MHLLDSIIAFAAIMLIASLIVTAGTQLIISLLGLRGANLRWSLTGLFENACDDPDAKRYGKVIARRALRHPLISGSAFSRFGIQIDRLPYVPADAAGKLSWAGAGIPFQSWILGALSGFFLCPASLAIITRLTPIDMDSLSNAIAAYVPFLNFVDHPWRTGVIVGAVLGGLIGRWRLATAVRVDELAAVLDKLSTPPGGLLPDPAQRAMLVIAGEIQNGPRQKTNSANAKYDSAKYDASKYGSSKNFGSKHDGSKYDGLKFDSSKREQFDPTLSENHDDEMSAAVEQTLNRISAQSEPRLDGVNSWFEHAMDRASQRFTLQARVITVVLAAALVCCAHLDAIRLFRSLSTDAETRAQLTAVSDAITRQAAQLPRTHEDAATVPDVYHAAMVEVLQAAPAITEVAKPKPARSSHRAIATTAASAAPTVRDSTGPSDGILVATTDTSAIAPALPPASEAPANLPSHKKSSRAKAPPAPPAEPAKSVATPTAERATPDAKARASKALDAAVVFNSREDAVSWLRGTLSGDPAAENLVSSYNHAVNAHLVTDTDKLLDQSASLDHTVARSEFQLFPDQLSGRWTDWQPKPGELPGLLVAIALLTLGAAICFNLLRSVASLRPVLSVGTTTPPDRRIRLEDRRYSKRREPVSREPVLREQISREPAHLQVKSNPPVPNKLDKKTEFSESTPNVQPR